MDTRENPKIVSFMKKRQDIDQFESQQFGSSEARNQISLQWCETNMYKFAEKHLSETTAVLLNTH